MATSTPPTKTAVPKAKTAPKPGVSKAKAAPKPVVPKTKATPKPVAPKKAATKSKAPRRKPIAPDATVHVKVAVSTAVLNGRAVYLDEVHPVAYHIYQEAKRVAPSAFAVRLPGSKEYVVEK